MASITNHSAVNMAYPERSQFFNQAVNLIDEKFNFSEIIGNNSAPERGEGKQSQEIKVKKLSQLALEKMDDSEVASLPEILQLSLISTKKTFSEWVEFRKFCHPKVRQDADAKLLQGLHYIPNNNESLGIETVIQELYTRTLDLCDNKQKLDIAKLSVSKDALQVKKINIMTTGKKVMVYAKNFFSHFIVKTILFGVGCYYGLKISNLAISIMTNQIVPHAAFLGMKYLPLPIVKAATTLYNNQSLIFFGSYLGAYCFPVNSIPRRVLVKVNNIATAIILFPIKVIIEKFRLVVKLSNLLAKSDRSIQKGIDYTDATLLQDTETLLRNSIELLKSEASEYNYSLI